MKTKGFPYATFLLCHLSTSLGGTNAVTTQKQGFTLIEISIVLVIIGLVAGGVLVGRDLIKAAEIRSLISQVDQFKIATNTFKQKYNAIPGDMSRRETAKFGFFTFTHTTYNGYGTGNGDGKISTILELGCFFECGAFWRHLSDAKLIATTGQTLSPTYGGSCAGVPVGHSCQNRAHALYMPKSKYGIAYLGAASLDSSYHISDIDGLDGTKNAFFLGKSPDNGYVHEPTISAIDAYTLDLKIDDGKPNSGKFLVSTYSFYGPPGPHGSPVAYGRLWSDGTVDAAGAALGSVSRVCTIFGIDEVDANAQYNADPEKGGNSISCRPVFVW